MNLLFSYGLNGRPFSSFDLLQNTHSWERSIDSCTKDTWIPNIKHWANHSLRGRECWYIEGYHFSTEVTHMEWTQERAYSDQ